MSVIEVNIAGPIRAVRLNRPEKRNALSREMLDGLAAAFTGEPGPEERLAVVRSAGPVFCAGLDLSAHQGDGPNLVQDSVIEGVLAKVESWPLPVVAIVQGDAIAGGNELALHCDLVVASTAARFGMSLAQIGLAPSWFLAKKLIEVLGPVGARKMLLLGDPLPATRFYELGAISHLAEPDALDTTAQLVIDRLAANAPLSLRAMKAVLLRQMAFRDAIAHEELDEAVRKVLASQDGVEGMAARLEKRPARFTGR